MRGLLAEDVVAERVAVERGAPAGEILDAGRGFGGDRFRDGFIDDAGARDLGVDGVGVRRVAFADRRSDAALGPGGGRAKAQWLGRDHGDGARRQLEGAEQACEASADDQGAVGVEDVIKSRHMFSSVRRAPDAPGSVPSKRSLPKPLWGEIVPWSFTPRLRRRPRRRAF